MTSPTELVTDDHSFNAGDFGLGQDTDIGASVFPLDLEDLAEAH